MLLPRHGRFTARPPQTDPRNIGVTFVDVLFAFVVGKILDRSIDGAVPLAGKAQLVLASTLTITSWIGYHNSGNRSPYFLRFMNWPLAQFLIDVTLVYVYWLCAVTSEAAPSAGHVVRASALPESSLVLTSGVLYFMWDLVAWRVRMLPQYEERPIEHDIPGRRWVSLGLALASATVLGCVLIWSPTSTSAVLAVDAVLWVVLVGYRFAKDLVTPTSAYQTHRSVQPDVGGQ